MRNFVSSSMQEWLFAHDKLHTVALVVLIIWMGLAIHLWRLSRRIEKLEKLTEKP